MAPTPEQFRAAVTFVGGAEPDTDSEQERERRFFICLKFDCDGDAQRFVRWAGDDDDDTYRVGDGCHFLWPLVVSHVGFTTFICAQVDHLEQVISELIEKWSHVERFDGVLLPTLET